MSTNFFSRLQTFSDGICKVLDSLVEDEEDDMQSSADEGALRRPRDQARSSLSAGPIGTRRSREDMAADQVSASGLATSRSFPQLTGSTKHPPSILTTGQVQQLQRHLPSASQVGATWQLLYSTLEHGVSIDTLYQKIDRRCAPSAPP